jgi:hypothetical protein
VKLDGTGVYGCDINPRMVAWCKENLQFAQASVNEVTPPLPYGDDTFGLVYAFSVMTHLPEDLQRVGRRVSPAALTGASSRHQGDCRRQAPDVAGAARGPTDTGRTVRLDLAARQRHPRRLESPKEHHLTFCKSVYRRRVAEIEHRLDGLCANVLSRRGNAQLALRLNQTSRWYPRLILWVALGLIAIASRRPRATGPLVALALAALGIIVLSSLGLFADPRFALPVAPALVLFGSCALLGRR